MLVQILENHLYVIFLFTFCQDHLNFHKLLGFNCQSPERRRLSKDQWFMNSEADLKQEERIHSSEGYYSCLFTFLVIHFSHDNLFALHIVHETEKTLFP